MDDKEVLEDLIAELENKVEELEYSLKETQMRKKTIHKELAHQIARISPANYDRIFAGVDMSECVIDPEHHNFQNCLPDPAILKQISGCIASIKDVKFEVSEDQIIKIWSILGKVGEMSFFVEFSTNCYSLDKGKSSTPNIRKIEIFACTQLVETVCDYWKSGNRLHLIVPNLYSLEKLRVEQARLKTALGRFDELRLDELGERLSVTAFLDEQNDVLVRVLWKFKYELDLEDFVNDIEIYCPDYVMTRFTNANLLKVLSGKVSLVSANEIELFIQALFENFFYNS